MTCRGHEENAWDGGAQDPEFRAYQELFEQMRKVRHLELGIDRLRKEALEEWKKENRLMHAYLALKGYGCMEGGPCYIGAACKRESCQAKARAAAPQ